MNADIKAAVEQVQSLLQAEREANDARFAAIETNGVVPPEVQSKLDNTADAASQAIEELKELQKQANDHSETIANLTYGPKGYQDDKDKLHQNASLFFAIAHNGGRRTQASSDQVDQYAHYVNAYNEMLRVGEKNLSGEYQNALRVGSDPDGGYYVPTEQSADIKMRIFETSPMRQLASVMTVTGDSVEFPTDTNDGTSGGWVGEQESRSETATPQVGRQKIYLREQFAAPQITQRLLDMATIDVGAWLERKTGDKIGRTENTAFVSGDGAEQPRGFLDYKGAAVTTDDATRSWGVLQQVVTGAAGAFPTVSGSTASDPDALITTISKLKPEYRAGARWVMNRATEAAVRKLKDADGRYFIDFGNIEAGAVGFSLFGFPITTAEDMPDFAADSYSIAFGNFSTAYQIIDGPGLRLLRDPYTAKPEVVFYFTKYTGGDVVNFDALKLVKASA